MTATLDATDARPIGKVFVTAGKAIFTVSNPTGTRYTFKVSKGSGRASEMFFVSYLTGSDNENDYTYLGMLNPENLNIWPTKASPRTFHEMFPVKVLKWALKLLAEDKPVPDGYSILHAGRCGRCGRTLTVPESIETGLGPECAGKVGL